MRGVLSFSLLRLFVVMLYFCAVSIVSAQSKLDLSLLKIQKQHETRGLSLLRSCTFQEEKEDEPLTVIATIRKGSNLPINELEQIGVTVGTCIGRVATLRVPASRLRDLSDLAGIESLSANRRHQVSCFNTRLETGVCQIHDASWSTTQQISYTGKGVLLGIIDTGIEYNHLNFLDPETGATRLKGAILYRPEEGAADSVREYYTEPQQIDTLTTDCVTNAHGTHTAGVAGGSYLALGQQGMAPEADLMLCGTSVLEDDRLIDALVQTFARAEELDEPCVVNLSIGNPVGWKDGLSPLNLVCDALTEGGEASGRIIVFSAGNDGAKSYVVNHKFLDAEPVYVLLEPHMQKGEAFYFNPNLDVYCSDSLPLTLEYQLYDTLCHAFSPLPFEQHLLDTLEAGHDSRRHLIIDADTCCLTPYPHNLLACRIQGNPGTTFSLYYINNVSVSYAILPREDEYHWLHGSPEGSISDLCTTPSVLSVGAYSAVDSLVNVFGRVHHPVAPCGQVCDFSSYGFSAQGQPYPDVLCPGASVVSSFSRFWADKVAYYYTNGRYLDSPMMYVQTPDSEGPTYYWIHAVGTSQSSPVLAGIIALWLQACPTLSVRQIREILQQTAVFDNACVQAPGGAIQTGFGKVDAVAGLQAVLSQSSSPIISLTPQPTDTYYNLQGQKLSRQEFSRGLCIINGVKVWKR